MAPAALSAAAAAALAAFAFVVLGTTASAAPTGTALVITPPDPQNPGQTNLERGGSQTKFTLKLPLEGAPLEAARCSGDTAAGNFHIFSYLVDATAIPDPGTIVYSAEGPVQPDPNNPIALYSLLEQTGVQYANRNTAPQSGFVSNIPTFDFNLFSVDERITATAPDGTFPLPLGTYNIGIACAKADNTTDKYWNSQLTFTPSATDSNGFTWTVSDPSTTTTFGGSTTTTSEGSTTTTSGGSTTTTSGGSTTTTSGGSTTTTTSGGSGDTAGSGDFGGSGDTGGSGDSGGSGSVTAASPSGSLATTGRSVLLPVLAAMVLLYVGLVVVLGGRRRRWRRLTDGSPG